MTQRGGDADRDLGRIGPVPVSAPLAASGPGSPALPQPLPWSSQPPVKSRRSFADRVSDALDHLVLGLVMVPLSPWVVLERRRRRIDRRSGRGAETDRAIEAAMQRLRVLLQPPGPQTGSAAPRDDPEARGPRHA